jgi:beta-galactosidase/beta-glucuronidase
MTEEDSPGITDTLSVREMQDWLKQELLDSSKAHALRAKEATEFVTKYAEGKMTPETAMQKLLDYEIRWGEALYGATAIPGKSDTEILREIDKARQSAMGTHVRKITDTKKGSIEPSI